ncbi:MAG: Leu/Phe/Val dehydrogenase [Fidelibacterota bacterium]
MKIFVELEKKSHEQVIFCSDQFTGLRAIIAIHDTTLGPALGGARMWKYDSEDTALIDVLRLSRGMTYKAAAAGLNLGGGKAVIIGDPKKGKNEMLFRSFGRFVNGLGGRYITAEDVGTSVRDMEWVRAETRYVTGISRALGGSGDPSPVTALGVYTGMKACAKVVFGSDSLTHLKIAVQGLGHVGSHLVEYLAREEAALIITDIDREKVERIASKYKAEGVEAEQIYSVDADIFAPCALGGIINDRTIPEFKFKIIAGGANNQLENEKLHSRMLYDAGILYAPDYVINAGGLINVYNELQGYNRKKALSQAEGIYDILMDIFKRSEREGVPTNVASDKIAEDRINAIARIKRTYSGSSDFLRRIAPQSSTID